MKLTWDEWRDRFAEILNLKTDLGFNESYGVANGYASMFDDDYSPEEAVDEELSYWTDDGD